MIEAFIRVGGLSFKNMFFPFLVSMHRPDMPGKIFFIYSGIDQPKLYSFA